MPTKLRIAAAALAATTVAGAAYALPAHQSAQARNGSGTVATIGMSLTVRQSPSVTAASTGFVHEGERITITCQTVGDQVAGRWGTTNLWDKIEGRGFVADGWVDTGVNGRLPGVPECQGGAEPTKPPATRPSTDGRGQLVPLRQYYGQSTQWHDCGPASAVVALLHAGRTPKDWDANRPVDAIVAFRNAVGGTGGTHGYQLANVLNTYDGIQASTVQDYASLRAAVRSGTPVIMSGNAVRLPWPVNVKAGTQVVDHWVYVASYDASDDTYQVVDPISMPGSDVVHRIKPDDLKTFFDTKADMSIGGVIVRR